MQHLEEFPIQFHHDHLPPEDQQNQHTTSLLRKRFFLLNVLLVIAGLDTQMINSNKETQKKMCELNMVTFLYK